MVRAHLHREQRVDAGGRVLRRHGAGGFPSARPKWRETDEGASFDARRETTRAADRQIQQEFAFSGRKPFLGRQRLARVAVAHTAPQPPVGTRVESSLFDPLVGGG